MKYSIKTVIAASFALAPLAAPVASQAGIPGLSRPVQQHNLVQKVRIHCRGHRCWDDHRHHRHHRHHGTIHFGIGGVYVRPPVYVPPRVYRYDRYSAHVRWCLHHYKTYDPRTDTFMSYSGYRKRCRGPY